MPGGKSKRDRVVHLTKTKKKGNLLKMKVISRTR